MQAPDDAITQGRANVITSAKFDDVVNRTISTASSWLNDVGNGTDAASRWSDVTNSAANAATSRWSDVTNSAANAATSRWSDVTNSAVNATTSWWSDVTDSAADATTTSRWSDVTGSVVNATTSWWSDVTNSAANVTTTSRWSDVTNTSVLATLNGSPAGNTTTEASTTVVMMATPPEGCLVVPFSVMSPWNHPEDLVSHETQQAVQKVVNAYLLTALVLVAVPTNVLNMAIFWKLGVRERINLCLFFLSLADLIIVFSHWEWNLDRLYSEITGQPYKLVVMKFNVNNMIHSLAGFIYISGFLSTMIAMERCLCVVWPLKAQRIIQTRTALIVIGVGHVVIMAGHYVVATKWEVVCMFDPYTNQTTDNFYSSDFYLDHEALVNLFEGVIFGVLLPGLYVCWVLFSTVVTVVKLRRIKEWREKSSSAGTGSRHAPSTKDVTLTRMLIGTSCLFVACTTPPCVFHALTPFVPELSLSGKYYNTYYLLTNVQQMLTYVNSSVNFFVYYVFGTKFRATARALFCRAGGRAGTAAAGVASLTSRQRPAKRSSASAATSITSLPVAAAGAGGDDDARCCDVTAATDVTVSVAE